MIDRNTYGVGRSRLRALCAAAFLSAVGGAAAYGQETPAPLIIAPSAGGTLVDGGVHGVFDGSADASDAAFDRSGYDGAITLSTERAQSNLEHRVVWEYDLAGVAAEPPVYATFSFPVRGASVVPFPDVRVEVYAYPADLSTKPEDFSRGPAALQGSVTAVAGRGPTPHVLDVSTAVSDALFSGDKRVAFRFQIAADTPHAANQAFVDALDSDPASKPSITISDSVPGDATGDGKVDLADFVVFADCMAGPGAVPAPEPPRVADNCLVAFDRNHDGDVDLADVAGLQDSWRPQ